MHSSRSLRRPRQLVLSLSITLSFSPFLSSVSFHPALAPQRPSSPVSLLRATFLLFLSSALLRPPPFASHPLAPSRGSPFLPYRRVLRPTAVLVSLSIRPSPRSLSVPISSFIPSSLSPPCLSLFFFPPSASLRHSPVSLPRSANPSPRQDSLSPMFIYHDRLVCRGVHHTARGVRAYVHEARARDHTVATRVSPPCRASSSGDPLGSAYRVTCRVRGAADLCDSFGYACISRETRKNGRMYRRGGVGVRGGHVCTLAMYRPLRTRVHAHWVSGGSSHLSS